MADYKKMYHIMFNAATKAERLSKEASEILIKAQRECEDVYVNSPDVPIEFPFKTHQKAAED